MRSKNSIACWIKHFECFQVIFLKNIIIKWNYAFISLIFHERIVQAFLCIMCYWRLVKHIEYSAIMGLWCTMVILLEAMFSFEFFLIEINPLYPHLSLDSFLLYYMAVRELWRLNYELHINKTSFLVFPQLFQTDIIYNHTECVGCFLKNRKYESNLSLAQHLKWNVGKPEVCSLSQDLNFSWKTSDFWEGNIKTARKHVRGI